jgi:hypothetical protein
MIVSILFRLKILVYPLLLIVGVNAIAATPTRVVVVFVDGVRYTETFGDPTGQFIPVMSQRLAPLGTVFTHFYNQGPTVTISGHASTLTGNSEVLENNGLERPHYPTLFDYAIQQGVLSSDQMFLLTAKNKLQIIGHSSHPDFNGIEGPQVAYPEIYGDDLSTFQMFKDIVDTAQPELMWVNLGLTDVYGHTGDWGLYISALEQADSLVGEIWNVLQADSNYANNTLMLVTNDHGRHSDGVLDGFVNHGDDCEGCRHLMLLALGPNVRPNHRDSTIQDLRQIASTVSWLRGISMPSTLAKAMCSVLPAQAMNLKVEHYGSTIDFKWDICEASGIHQMVLQQKFGEQYRDLVVLNLQYNSQGPIPMELRYPYSLNQFEAQDTATFRFLQVGTYNSLALASEDIYLVMPDPTLELKLNLQAAAIHKGRLEIFNIFGQRLFDLIYPGAGGDLNLDAAIAFLKQKNTRGLFIYRYRAMVNHEKLVLSGRLNIP